MWIRNLSVFVGAAPFTFSAAELEDKLAGAQCPPCGTQAQSSEGFVTPLKQDGRMVIASGDFLYCMHQETARLLPGAVVAEELGERVQALQEKEARKIGRKEKAELKEQIIFELLPRAFTRSRLTPVLIDVERGRVLVDCASATRAEQVISVLRRALGSLPVKQPTMSNAAGVFSQWLKQPESLPAGFTLGNRCELKDAKGGKSSVRFSEVDLDQDDVLKHLETMAAVRVNLAFRDELELDLQDDFAIKRIRALDLIAERIEALDTEDALDELMAQLNLQGGCLRGLIDVLFDSFAVTAAA